MKIKELITEFRTITGDLKFPYFWSDQNIIGYANKAEMEACRRALLIADTGILDVFANEPLVALDPLILFVRRVRLETGAKNLKLLSWRRVEETTPDWESVNASPVPFIAMPDWVSGALRLYPTPVSDDTARAAYFRLPLNPMTGMDDAPEINVRHHKDLLDHMLELGYAKHDADTFDPAAVKFYGDRFTTIFGPPVSGVAETDAERDTSRARHLPQR